MIDYDNKNRGFTSITKIGAILKQIGSIATPHDITTSRNIVYIESVKCFICDT
jgi:hypothetical protein